MSAVCTSRCQARSPCSLDTGTNVSLRFDLYLEDRGLPFMRVSCPTLIVMLKDQRPLGKYIQSKITRSKLETISDADHALFLEKLQTFNQLLKNFLGQQQKKNENRVAG